MIYLSGAINQAVIDHPRMGIMYSPNMGNRNVRGKVHARDNGRFGDRWNNKKWRRFLLNGMEIQNLCLFAVVPDVVGDAQSTFEEWRRYVDVVRMYGYRTAFAVQDGCSSDLVPWSELDVFFIGGSNEWKVSPELVSLVAEAKVLGKHVHMGRVNTPKRMAWCKVLGCDTVDGTYLTRGPRTNMPKLLRMLAAAS